MLHFVLSVISFSNHSAAFRREKALRARLIPLLFVVDLAVKEQSGYLVDSVLLSLFAACSSFTKLSQFSDEGLVVI